MSTICVTIWNEFVHETKSAEVTKIYPQGIHHVLAEALKKYPELRVSTATLHEPEHGLTDLVCKSTDVLLWWGNAAHDNVSDTIVACVHHRVMGGVGVVVM